MPEVLAKEGYDIDRLESTIVIALRQFPVIEPAAVIDTTLKETIINLLLDLNIKGVSRVPNANQIKESLLCSHIVNGLFPVVVTQDIADTGFFRQYAVQHPNQQLLVVPVHQDRLEAAITHHIHKALTPFTGFIKFFKFILHIDSVLK